MGASEEKSVLDAHLLNGLDKLSVRHGDGIEMVNVTENLRELCKRLNAQSIIKVHSSDLFQGTHALEVNNPKLDSHLIVLSEEELSLSCDCAHGANDVERLQYVTSIADRLLRSVITWLNEYQSLPATLLSCRYVEEFLIRNSQRDKALFKFNTDCIYYDQILTNIIAAICYFAAFVKSLLLRAVIFEEEDLNFNSMGLQSFDIMPPQKLILSELQKSLDLISDDSSPMAVHLGHILKAVRCLVHIEDVLTVYSTSTAYLDELIELARSLQSHTLKLEPPAGSFSMGIQKRRSNQFPPKNIVEPDNNYLGFIHMANSIKTVLRVSEADTAVETFQFAYFFNKLKQQHVLARAIFPLFLVRDNQNILGRYSIEDFLFSHLMEYSLMGTQVSEKMQSSPEVFQVLTPALKECANALFDWYQNASQNTARYRQGYNRQLIVWDSVQAQLETAELNFISAEIHDEVISGSDTVATPLMPYASWVFTLKVMVMIEFTLKGFDLDVYKPYEGYDMFWYVSYLAFHLDSCLIKIHCFIMNRIDRIHAMNKKMKKMKAGPKKSKLKEDYQELMSTEMGQLQTNKQYLNYLIAHTKIHRSLSMFQTLQFALLKSHGVIDNKPPMLNQFANAELIHSLRFKPFSSIGVPELPSYAEFESTINRFVVDGEPGSANFVAEVETNMILMEKESATAEEAAKGIIRAIEANDKNGEMFTGTKLVKQESLEYFGELLNSAHAMNINAKDNLKKLKVDPSAAAKRFAVTLKHQSGMSSFYPLFTVVEKKSRRTSCN
ncbi:Mak10p KNAG_0B03730 [Huiozyma naganishii CBS 8797]|uniref:Uncharacterized protein n=1 Tax=Huiozyma naganishii (strain ATCC MYA-139 / BCRC 22969 / CBS 8797 / KCTC 17520 / NBRC 10181 / NCYC 3082 / Yp74L-3) TaxID=1071383 RepID=J7S3N0_HUIN7|nr:hypothetical protein KNAG_0B03730 [Kazachstania naganishii CBS 8797]CCK68814.1 hypothetical protein KNAG_0B03730 [Kazachstania naganishii CBS 8797]